MCCTVRLVQRVERAFSMGTVEGACLTGGSYPSGAHLLKVKCGALWPAGGSVPTQGRGGAAQGLPWDQMSLQLRLGWTRRNMT